MKGIAQAIGAGIAAAGIALTFAMAGEAIVTMIRPSPYATSLAISVIVGATVVAVLLWDDRRPR